MKFLLLADDYTGTVIHNRLTQENHEVVYLNPHHRNNGISSISNIHQGLSTNPDCCIVASNRMALETHVVKGKGIPTFGGSNFEIALEQNEEIRDKFCKNHGIRWMKETTKVLYPISAEVWFCNGDPIYQYMGMIKQNRFMAGDLGKDVDGESIVLWSYNDRNVQVVDRLFANGLFDTLKSIHYTGIMSFDCVICEYDKHPYVYRIHTKFQASVLTAMFELYKDNFGDLIIHILQKKQTSILLQDQIAIAVAISTPPYPYDNLQGLVKYVVASDENWIVARKKIAKQIKELEPIKDLQYRIDGGIQAELIFTYALRN